VSLVYQEAFFEGGGGYGAPLLAALAAGCFCPRFWGLSHPFPGAFGPQPCRAPGRSRRAPGAWHPASPNVRFPHPSRAPLGAFLALLSPP